MSKKFDKLYAKTGRPSIPPEMLVKTLFLQVLYGIRSERLVLEQLDFNLLYRWFVGMTIDQDVWDETVFTKNRDRLFAGEALDTFFAKVIEEADKRGLLSHEHFSVDGTLIESWASLKLVRRTIRRLIKTMTIREIPVSIFTEKFGAMTPINLQRMPKPVCIARAKVKKRAFTTWDMSLWKTAMVWQLD